MNKNEKKLVNFGSEAIAKLTKIINAESETEKAKLKEWLLNESKLFDEPIKKETITFGSVTLEKLMEIVNIKQAIDKSKFSKWFGYKYKLSEEESDLLEYLIEKNTLTLKFYNEIELTTKFISPILNKVDFDTEDFTGWYGHKISCELNNYILNGEPDFAVATGIMSPKEPYFFLHEHKRSVNFKGYPEFQVLAAMLAAMTISKVNIMRGAYVIGETWKFIILEKSEKDDYKYFVHEGFNCLKFNDLKQIYINLQAVKHLYCK
jgi:hypothetical protein